MPVLRVYAHGCPLYLSGAGAMGSFELPDMDAGNGTQVLCKSG